VARQHALAKELAIGAIGVFAAPELKARHRREVEGTSAAGHGEEEAGNELRQTTFWKQT
jgi:hypothetical protein